MSHKNLINNLKKVKNLESVGQPEAGWVLENRNILMSQINPQGKKSEEPVSKYYYEYVLEVLSAKVLRPAMMAVLVVGAYFGYSAVTLAAKASLPGESLYPIKVLGEKIQLAATLGDEGKVKLKMDFISRRGDELQQIAKAPDDDKSKTVKIASTVKQITEDVSDVKAKIEKMAEDSSAASVINTAKVVDDKTLKVEKDLVDAHASLSTEVKKEVAKDVKEAIAKTEEVGNKALIVMVNKSEEKEAKDANQSVTDKELTSRVSERIKSSEIAVAAVKLDVGKISTSTETIAMDKIIVPLAIISPLPPLGDATAVSSGTVTTTLKEAVKNVSEKPQAATAAIEEAKNLLDKKDFTSALQKVAESKAIVAEVIEKAPIIDARIQSETATAASNAASSTPVK